MIIKNSNLLNCLSNLRLMSDAPKHKKLIRRHFFVDSHSRSPVKLSYASYTSPGTAPLAQLPPVIIMHGLFGSKNNWNTLAKAINQQTKRQVFTIDARNHGDSPHSSDMTYISMADDVKHLLADVINVDKSIVIGHSMGGAAMMCTALNYPQIIAKLIIADMSPIKTSPSLYEMTKIIDTLLAIKFENFSSLSEARKAIDKQLSASISSVSLRQFLLTNVIEVPNSPGQYKWRINLNVIAQNFTTNIAVFPQLIPKLKNKSFDGDTLFIAGKNSDYIKVEDESSIKTLFPKAEITYIDGAGHWVQSDKPAEFLQIACDFINR